MTTFLYPADVIMVEQFQNFLSWQLQPRRRSDREVASPFPCPPAVYAYVAGHTTWCPPIGEL
jgi:hypothetical protein